MQFAIFCMSCLSLQRILFTFQISSSLNTTGPHVFGIIIIIRMLSVSVIASMMPAIGSQQCHAVAGKILEIVRKFYVTREDVGGELHKGLSVCVGIEKALMFLWATTGLEQE